MVPTHVLFTEDGEMDKRLFLNSWKEIPEQNELQFQLNLNPISSDDICSKLKTDNKNIETVS